ncbi:helix-turn-helix domain-containing protein [Noviherbaspirillum sp. ST9]|uniref:helix-turn-helix domain-containing protein n=1 Tax=Noviherbaspirillum sp. ST9 TaxID=3401606 RepID=UPI003B58A6B1
MAEPASLFLWHGRALIVGPGIDSTPHAHFAAQITLGLDRPFRVRLGADAPWVETQAAVFAPNQQHQLDCGGSMLAHLFVELPQRQHAVATEVNAAYNTLPDFQPVNAAIEAARNGMLDLDTAENAAQQWLCCALPSALSHYGSDARISRALEWIAANPGVTPSGELLAAQVHLSESRFTHLFRQQTGLSLSRYLLWLRLFEGVAAVARGDNMTAAAHRAGFSDLAHMSRTFRSTFGVVPSELHKMTIAFKQKAG